jgi:hypothetical protein
MIPVNSIAKNIAKLRSDNELYLEQVATNEELIEQLEPLAEWAEEPEQPEQPEVVEIQL